MKTWTALLMVFLAIIAWSGFGGLMFQVSNERANYIDALERSQEESLRGESATRLRSTIESSAAEREALEGIFDLSILRVVEVIEQAGRAAGASDVSIGEASPSASGPDKMTAISIVVNASGSFVSLTRAVSLFETLPIPASLEQFELQKIEQENSWSLTARLRVLTAPPSL